jgi:hypothetical protein
MISSSNLKFGVNEEIALTYVKHEIINNTIFINFGGKQYDYRTESNEEAVEIMRTFKEELNDLIKSRRSFNDEFKDLIKK